MPSCGSISIMNKRILIAGGGIGGLAAALSLSRAGAAVTLIEQANAFGEVGAGIQLGPNAVRVLNDWGLMQHLTRIAAFPRQLRVRNAEDGRELGRLHLGVAMRERYGMPYATVHRADIHGVLLDAVRAREGMQLHLQTSVDRYDAQADGVRLMTTQGPVFQGDALIGCDGLWSKVRQQMLGDGGPRAPGHLAYRAMVPQASLPESMQTQDVTVWLGPRLHVVQYPVRGGEWLNIVAIIEGRIQGDQSGWDQSTNARDLRLALGATCAPLRQWVNAIPSWLLWVLHDRPPLRSASQYSRGRVALLGDAAHPTRPYLAQGAAMALEDAHALGELLRPLGPKELPEAFKKYGQLRHARNARIQTQSTRNGEIFHATGPMRWGRNFAMNLLGERLLDNPWLYRGPSHAL